MTNATFGRSSVYRATAVAFAGALLSTLVLGMALWAGPLGAQTCPPGEPDCEPPNFPPTVDADSSSVLAVRGQTATNTGSYSDRFDDGDVAIEASVGEVTKTGTSSGTWSWSPADAPLGRQRVTITATDGYGESSTTEFTLTGTLPNGKIAFASWRDDIRYKIFAMNADGTAQTNLTNTPDAYDDVPAFSPDGTKIAFVRNPDARYDIYVMNANGTGVIRLTNDEALDASPAFSPDGTKIAFSSTRQDSSSDIYVMNADGTNPIRLTNDEAYDDAPAYSPDGTKIAFWSNRDGDDEIYVMSADGSGVTRLTNNLANDFDPAFSPDGTKIAFGSRRDGNYEVYVMNADGTGQTNLTKSLRG